MTCEVCGLRFNHESISDREIHRKYHNEYVNGIRWARSAHENILSSSWEGGRIVLVDETSPRSLKNLAAEVGTRGNAETNFEFGVYDGDETYPQKALIGVVETRAVSIMVLQPIPSVRSASWEEYDAVYRSEISLPFDYPSPEPLGCSFIWVLPAFRGRGLARAMTECAQDLIGVSTEDLPWTVPFTDLGRAYVSSICPDRVTVGYP